MNNKTAGEVVAEILMLHSVKKGYAFLIVEGRDDWKFWKTRVHALCEIVYSTGKAEGVTAVRRLNVMGFAGHVGVFDRDYGDALKESNWHANEIYWDAHSLETVLFYSGAFDAVVTEFCDPARIDAVERQAGRAARELVEWIAATVGALRYLHALSGSVNDAGVLFPTNYVREGPPFIFDETALYTEGVALGLAPSIAQLRAAIREFCNIPARRLIRGHDVSGLAAWLMRFCGGTCGHERVEQTFRVGFTPQELESTTVYQELREWEVRRAPRRVLP